MQLLLCLAIATAALCSEAIAQWSQLPGNGTHRCLAIYATNDAVVAATQDSNVIRSTDQGGTWVPSSEGIHASIFTFTIYGEGHNVYLGSNGGGYRSTDGGRTWDKINVSLSTNVYAFYRSGNNVFMGGDSGVFRSTDNGQSWQKVSSGLPSSVVIRSFVSNDKYLYAGTTLQAVYRSTDNGEHWERSGTGMHNKSTISSIWAEGSDIIGFFEGGGWYRSSDYGDTWEFHPEAFNTSASAEYCVSQIGTTLFIGTENGVQRSVDRGLSWKDISDGMNVRALVLSMSVQGDYLYAGSRNHWIWRRPLSEILPPAGVVSVAFSSRLLLDQNLPNPVSSSALISYILSTSGTVSLKLYDVMGHEVRTLVSERQEAGEHSVTLDASDLPNGVYYYRLSTDASSLTRRMLVVK